VGPEYEKRIADQAAAYRSPIRAIRLPNGRMLFTNQEEYGGEMSAAEGGRVVRAQDRASARKNELPARAAITGMLQASIRDASMRDAQRRGETETVAALPFAQGEGRDPRPVEGRGLSMIEGTPEIQRQIALEDAMGALNLAEARQRTELANLPAEARLVAEDPNIRLQRWALANIQPKITAIQQQAAAEIAQIKATITDPREQAKMIDEVEVAATSRIEPLNALMSMVSRQRLPQT